MVSIGENISGTQYDVARQKWGGDWRMPTGEDVEELIDNCIWIYYNYKGINGYKVIGSNGNCIFLPSAGYRDGSSLKYAGWDGDYRIASAGYGSCHIFNNGNSFDFEGGNIEDAILGYTVRPVKSK